MAYGFQIMVEGDYACFSRPEMKVERVSYDVPTPSALEGLIKSIYWKPPVRYRIDKIFVYHPIQFLNVRRNECKSKVSYTAVRAQMKENGSPVIYTSEDRTQRASMILKHVKYGIAFHMEMTGLKADHPDECEAKHYNILLRRLRNGQCFCQPCLGCREFPVKKIILVDELHPEEISPELKGDIDLGYMLYGMRFHDGGKPINGDWEHPQFSDKADAVYYRPHMIDGIIDVKKYREGIIC